MPKNVPDQGIIYESLKKEIQGDLKDLKKTGFDTSKLYKEYQQILSDVENDLSGVSTDGSLAATTPMAVYLSGQAALEEFQKKLKRYDAYYNCFYSCEILEAELAKKDLKLIETLPNMVEEICKSLDVFLHTNSEIYQKRVVEKVVALAYRLMKLEFVLFGESKVFDKVVQMPNHIGLFEALIREDLNKVDLNEKQYSQIKNRFNHVQQNGIKSHLVDEKLIVLVAGKIDEECKKILKKGFQNCQEKRDIQLGEYRCQIEQYNQANNSFSSKKKRVIPKLVGRGLLLVGTTIIGSTLIVGKMEPMVLKNIEDAKIKQYTTSYYPTRYEEMFDGEVVASFSKDELNPDLDESKIIVYTPYQKNGDIYTREVTTYTLPATSASLSLEELANYNLSEVKGDVATQQASSLFPSEMYEQDMIRIVRILDEKKSYDVFDQESYEKDLELAQNIISFIIRVAVNTVLAGEWIFLLKALTAAFKEAKRKREYSEQVTKILGRILVLFQENEELRRNFDKLYPLYESMIPDNDAAILQTSLREMGNEMQETIATLQYRLKKRPQ